MQPLNPALLDNNNGFTSNKKQLNKTIKNQKNISNGNQCENIQKTNSPEINSPEITSPEINSPEINSPEINSDQINSNNLISDQNINQITNRENQQPLNKITQINDVMNSIFNQNNESLNSTTIFDISSKKEDNANVSLEKSDKYRKEKEHLLTPTKTYNPETILPSNNDKQYSNINNFSTLNDNMININRNQNNNTELLQKLNYVIYLLEEQRGQKSNYVTEEIILYIFLGIFIIFVLDKFSRPAKYVR